MPRRTATLLASLVMLIALICAGMVIPVPYSEMYPGPTTNTLGEDEGEPVLQISGHKTYPTSGHLDMVTVRVTGAEYRMNLFASVVGWLKHDSLVVPHKTLYPEGQTAEQSDQQNAEEFTQSLESAKSPRSSSLVSRWAPRRSWHPSSRTPPRTASCTPET